MSKDITTKRLVGFLAISSFILVLLAIWSPAYNWQFGFTALFFFIVGVAIA